MIKKPSVSISGIDDQLIKETVLSYIIAILLILVSLVFVWPRFSDVAVVKNNLKTANSKIDTLKKNIEDLDKYNQIVSETDEDLIIQALPLKLNPGLVLDSLREVSQNNNVNIVDYSIGGGTIEEKLSTVSAQIDSKKKTKAAERLDTTEIDITVMGNTTSLLNFMSSIERSLPLATITEVSINQITEFIKKESLSDVNTLKLKIEYYYYPLKDDLATGIEAYTIRDDDLKIVSTIKEYAKPVIGRDEAVTIPGGNRNIFGEGEPNALP